MAELERLLPRNRADPSSRVVAFDKATIAAYGAERDGVSENGQPNRDDAAIDHLTCLLRRNRRHLPAANKARPALDRLDSFLLGPAIDVVLYSANHFRRLIAGNTLEQDSFHLGLRSALGEVERVLLAFVCVAMNVDSVFQLDMRRLDLAGTVLPERRIGGDAPFSRRSRNYILAPIFHQA